MDLVPWEAAPSLMDMIQRHLDSAGSHEDRNLRKACIQCLLRLNKCHFSLSPSLYLVNVMRDGSHPITAGGFADIWRGRLKDDQLVCLKVLRVYTGNFDNNKLMKQLGNEVLIWRQLRHPNIHEFLGVTSELFKPSYCIVSPWMANGDVMSYCRERNSSLEVKVAMMREFCDGLRYLHEYNPPIVHSDIKGMNILVSDDGHCRISDFGLSTIENDSPEGRVSDSTSQAAMRGSIPWLAPELMNPGGVESPNRTTRDIYALGCTMYEILAESPPFSDRKMDPQIMIAVLSGVRPTRPVGCPDELWTIIEKCWTEDSGSRLIASQVASLLVKVTSPTPESDTQHPHTRLSDHNDLYLPNMPQQDSSSPQQQPIQSLQTSSSNNQPPFNPRLSTPVIPSIFYLDTLRSHASPRASPTQTTSSGQTASLSSTLYILRPMTNDDESQNQSSHVTRPSSPAAIDAHLQPPLSKGRGKVNQKGKTFITRGACSRCKGLKNLYRFKSNTDRCKRCADGGHECILPGRKIRGAGARLECQSLFAKIQKQAETIAKLKALLAEAANILDSPTSDAFPSPPSPVDYDISALEEESMASHDLSSLPGSRADSPVRPIILSGLHLARSDYFNSSASSVASAEEDAEEIVSDVDEAKMDDLETESMAGSMVVEIGSMEDLVETSPRSFGMDYMHYDTSPTTSPARYLSDSSTPPREYAMEISSDFDEGSLEDLVDETGSRPYDLDYVHYSTLPTSNEPAPGHATEKGPNLSYDDLPSPLYPPGDSAEERVSPSPASDVFYSISRMPSPVRSLARSCSSHSSSSLASPSSLASFISSDNDDEGRMDDYTLDPIWDNISVQDAWKGFRSRVGTSELAGVPSALQVSPVID
ncbi:Homeobox protein tos8 [Marasmius sp. AFHP31]|nr:Homeobox protein tos8 [Marasmius sp. AFHP31]